MPTTTDENISVLINGLEFKYWSDFEVHLSLDAFSTIGFSAPFEPDRKEFRDTFRPFSFQNLDTFLNTKPLFTGTLIDIVPNVDSDSAVVACNGYAFPGVLQDCPAPASILPLEFKGLGLRRIAAALAAPFGILIEFRESEGAVFDKVALETDQKIYDFLADLARQRNLIISNTAAGVLLFWRSVTPGKPVARLAEGTPPVTSVTPAFSPREYFSEITGFASAKRAKGGSKYTQRNPWLRNVVRPTSFKLEDTEPAGTPEATKAKLGRMFGNMASYTIDDLPTWRDPQGKLWEPNTTITLLAPSAMIYTETEFIIRDVFLRQDEEKLSASLNVVLPGAFSGQPPERLPWN